MSTKRLKLGLALGGGCGRTSPLQYSSDPRASPGGGGPCAVVAAQPAHTDGVALVAHCSTDFRGPWGAPRVLTAAQAH